MSIFDGAKVVKVEEPLVEDEPESKNGYICDDCGEVSDPEQDDIDVALYECNCGTIFNRNNSYNDNHQCPDCLKFAGKVAAKSCPHCEQGQVRECLYFEDNDGNLVEVE